MKTIEEKAIEYTESKIKYEYDPGYFEDVCKSFMKGSEFAQRWIPIERDKDGLVKNSTMDEMESNVPFITRLTNDEEFQYDIWYEFSADIDFDQFYTHWRPIELK